MRLGDCQRPMGAVCCLLLMLFVSQSLVAEHITDKLIAGLYPKAAAKGKPIALLPSGTPVEVVERGKGFIKVRLADGKEGWVEKDYVTDEKPAKVVLLEAQARIAELEQQLAAAADPAATECPEPAAEKASTPACAVSEAELVSAREQLVEVAARLGYEKPGGPIKTVTITSLRNDDDWWGHLQPWLPLLTALAGAIVGGLVSWRVINRRVRDHFGGIQF